MFKPTISKVTSNTTSSPESVGGAERYGSRGGPTMNPSGRGVAHVNPSASQAKEAESTTPDTFGPFGENSLRSARLQSCLESKLRVRLAETGSPLYVLKWKHWDMGLGPPICALRASARRISDNDFGGWPTPRTSDAHGPGLHGTGGMDLRTAIRFRAPRTTPRTAKEYDATTIGGVNPAWLGWLMGFPTKWREYAPGLMPSSRKSRKRS